ncbi:hypothetical protein Pla163_04760 [Planctomycetes bacterium Pla163]|uniref:Uncharacterized protein n=1 Tax=Rohdeia mirabilis TaxID=2528008 RepID=A0A518CVX0_9BACT|nr:hypothetical protein Pla163_04760 [Planctomycetes bacterium Pla163]
MNRIRHLLVAAAGVLAVACAPTPVVATGVLAGLAQSDAMTIHALYPYLVRNEDGQPVDDDSETFHGYRILGSADVDDPSRRDLLVRLVERGIEDSDGRVAACFNPRHGLSIVVDGQVTDLVICFECHSMSVYEDGVEVAGHLTARGLAPQVTALFEEAGLTIHRDEEDEE